MKNSTFLIVMAVPIAIIAALSSGFKLDQAIPGMVLVAFMLLAAYIVAVSDAKSVAKKKDACKNAPHNSHE